MPAMPTGVEEGILKGLYRYRPAGQKKAKLKAHLFGSGAILNKALEAQQLLAENYDVAADVWSITSFKQLHTDGLAVERWNRMHPGEPRREAYLTSCLKNEKGPFVIASDYVKALPESIARWFPRPPVSLGTDGFGRSESREALRDFFEVDARFIALGALSGLADQGQLPSEVVNKAMKEMDIPPEKADPRYL